MSKARIGIAAVGFLCLVSLAPRVRAQLAEDYRFQGKIIDQHGQPIPAVMVSLHDNKTGTRIVFTTNEDGTFDRRMIPAGIYDATFEKAGYVPYSEHFDWSATETQTILKIAQIVLESEASQTRKELGKKEAKLYEDAYAALGQGDYAGARKNAEELLSLGAGSFEYAVRFVIARSEAMQGAPDSALAEYGRVLALKPDLFEARFDLAGLLEQKGQHDDALNEYGKAADLNPSDAETQYDLGVILLKARKDYTGAVAHLKKAIELKPDHSQAMKALGFADLWADQKDVAEGVAMLKKYLELEPKAADAGQIRDIINSFESAPASGK